MDDKEIKNRFTWHPPVGDQSNRYTEIRKRAGDLAEFLNGNVPDCREKALAINRLDEVVFYANAAIARHDKP